MEESNALLEKMSTESGRGPTPTVRQVHFIFVQFACFVVAVFFFKSLNLSVVVLFLSCFAVFLQLWPFRRSVLQNRGGMGRRTHSPSSLIPLAVVLLSDVHFSISKKKKSVRTHWSIVSIIVRHYFGIKLT